MHEIPISLNPKLFRAIETICKNAITYGQNHKEIRQSISNLAVLLEQSCSEPSVEVVNLRNLLRRHDENFEFNSSFRSSSDSNGRPSLRLDPIHELSHGSNPSLSPDQQASAYSIKKIWTSFGRYLNVAARNMEGSGNAKGRRLDPIDVMGDEIALLWEYTYKPWYESGKRRFIGRSGINEVEVTLKVVVEGIFPHESDLRFGLAKGSSLAALQNQLDRFNDPRRANAARSASNALVA